MSSSNVSFYKIRLSERWNSLLHHTEQWSRRLDEMLPVSEKKRKHVTWIDKKRENKGGLAFFFSVHIPFPDSNFAQSFFCSKKGEGGGKNFYFLVRFCAKVGKLICVTFSPPPVPSQKKTTNRDFLHCCTIQQSTKEEESPDKDKERETQTTRLLPNN